MRGELFASTLTTDSLLAATADRRWIAAMLDAEAALSRALADVGLVAADVAERVAAACRPDGIDVAALGRAARDGANPVIPLVEQVHSRLGGDDAGWLHHGATSQDILDTAAQLVARDAIAIVHTDLAAAADAAAALAGRYRATRMIGRTLLQHAPPITFGFKAAGWLVGLLDAAAGLRRFVPAVQLGGPVGTTPAYGDRAVDVVERFADRLDLAVPTMAWHTARQRVAELGSSLAIVAATAAKVTGDVALLMQPEVAEAAEPAAAGRGRSSSIPGKRNPVLAAEARAAAATAGPLASVLISAVVADHERPAGAWQAEWGALTDLLCLGGGAIDRCRTVLEGLEIDEQAMAARAGDADPGPTDVWIDRAVARHDQERCS